MLIPWRPFVDPYDDFEKIIEAAGGRKTLFSPAFDVYEKGKDIIIEAPLTGVDPQKVEISITNDVLTIQGKTENKSEVEEKNYFRKEIRTGSFFRRISLPAKIIGEKAKASYNNGVLRIVAPKAEEIKKKKIVIKVKNN